mgnify:FL=1
MTERRLNMIIEKEYFDSEEVRKANAMNDKTMAPLRRIRLATTDSNKYYAKAVFVANKENIITGELLYRPDFQESEEEVAFSEVVVKQTADVEEYFKNLIRFEGYKVIPEEYEESDMLMHYDELSIQANKLLFLRAGGVDMTDTQNEVFKSPVNKIRLFEHGAPGSQNLKLTRKYYTEDMPDGRVKHIVQNITDPDIVPYIPDGIGNSTDRQRIPAVLIIPGGAFRRLVYNFEGEDVAKWLNSMGIAAFVLECRLPSDEHDNAEDVPLIDAMRAMRVIRGRAQEFGIDEAKIGVMGFSAGGFMAALLSTAYESDVYADYKYKDEYDKLSARPDFAVCSYPVISIDDCIEAGKRYMSEEQVLERISDSKAKILHKYNPDKLVRPDMPPVFICETDDDRTTLSENSVGFYMAARKAGVSAELHIFRTGGHGYGCGDDFAQTGEWKVLFTKWIKSIGIIS